MNVWSLDKHPDIKLLLIRLQEQLDLDKLQLSSEDLGSRAVRFHDRDIADLSAYLYSYGESQGRYGIHLELPSFDRFQTIMPEIYEDTGVERLVELMMVHFSLQRKSPA